MWSALQCAIQGRSHLTSGTPCQDKTFHIHKNETEIIALADGAGSAKMSHFGAELVTQKICELLSEQFDNYYNENDGVTVKRVIMSFLINELEKLSNSIGCETKELASTLLVAAIHDDKYIIIHIGDGVIGYIKDNVLKIASHPNNGEFVNTTVFVTSADALASMKLIKGELNGITGFSLMSDGTETSMYDKKEKKLSPAVKKLMDLSQMMDNRILQMEIEKSFEEVVKTLTDDDCSLALLVEEDYSFPGYNALSISDKKKLLQLQEGVNIKRQIRRCDYILDYAVTSKSLRQISRRLFMRKKTCIKYINKLIENNMMVEKNGLYTTSIIMSKKGEA